MYQKSPDWEFICTEIGFNGRLFSAGKRRNGQSDAKIPNFQGIPVEKYAHHGEQRPRN